METAYRRAGQDGGKSACVLIAPPLLLTRRFLLFVGKGVFARQKILINGRVMDPHLWNSLQEKLETQFQNLTRDAKDQVHAANQRHLQAIRMALDTLRNENVVLEAERYPEFRERMRVQVVDAQRSLENIAAAVRAASEGNNMA